MRIAVDIMGGDQAPHVLHESAVRASELYSGQHEIVVLYEKDASGFALHEHPGILYVPCGMSVSMDESLLLVARERKDSSMAQGLSMLAANEVDAYVTTGSTAALVIKSRKQLSLIEGVDKPGLLATLPSQAGPISLIDAGAIVRVGIPSIIQFAKLASIYQHLCFGKRKVKVGLLNIGRERSKGTGEVQQAFSELESYQSDNLTCNFDFIGNIEAREVFEGNVDVVVTDGFTGNVFLKSTEGTSAFILNYLSQILPQDVLQQANLRQAFHYQEYPGALLCGVNKLVIKSHGYSTAQGFFESIKEAANLAESALVAKLKATYEA